MNINETRLLKGKPYPFGAYSDEKGTNFAIYIKDAETVSLCFFEKDKKENPLKEFKLSPSANRTGDVWHAYIESLPENITYGYRVTRPNQEGFFLIHDPYSKALDSPANWNPPSDNEPPPYLPLSKTTKDSFDWENDQPLQIPMSELIIYEMHVRGFTKDPSSNVEHPGTFQGVVEKIPYLKSLGINAIELMPIFEFNENEALQVNPLTKEKLCNYFGYSTVNFFSLMNRYASHSENNGAINEFKNMVKELHKNGIEVILDVVYNHTAEGNEKGPTFSFKALSLHNYYMIDAEKHFLNFSGCGNTVNSNDPIVIEFILASLRYWVTEMHVDGFRFDLAPILGRAENGVPLPHAPLIEAISKDPILSQTKLIAEPWDAGGLYQVGAFIPGSTRWSEWNGKYRDMVRRFIKGTPGHKPPFATALCGSQDLYGIGRTPYCSINFVTSHDGFSLADLVTYNEKHNEVNGEENKDGFDYNDSWNCGHEGHSSNKKIVALRERQIRNFILVLMLSQGVPMLLMGDEYAHTRNGNNNTWCQDNKLNWFLWDKLENRPGFWRFVSSLINFRKTHPLLRKNTFLTDQDITWHGIQENNPDWGNDDKFIAFTLQNPDEGPHLYVAFNTSPLLQVAHLPKPCAGKSWYWVVNTHHLSPDDFYEASEEHKYEGKTVRVHSYSSIMLEAR